ncbi:AEC family transporter [Amorphus sp. 3PC139-8]|uniref:AEC family transporter n=1 Tax=Amorphus sp. 3PC139-8 TaxID=2735676 RepID=UPI00345CCBFE
MHDVLSLAFPFFGLIFLGYGAGRIIRLPADGLAWLNFFVIYLALPALFFQLLSETPIEQLGSWGFIVSTTLVTLAMFALAFGVGVARTGGDLRVATIQGIVGSYSNVGYLGPGLTLAALGPAATVPTALIFCFDSALLFVIVSVLMAVAGREGEGAGRTAFVILKRIFTHPFILATIAGIAAAAIDFEPPQALDRLLTMLRGAAAPCALFAIGVTVSSRSIRRVPSELPALLAIKLVLHPIIIFVVLSWVGGIDPLWIATAVLMAGLPPATNCFVLASQYQVYVERASSAVLIGTVVSVVTVTALLYLVTHDLLPVLF